MALTPKLDIRLGQSLVVTPQLQQAIRLLQLSNLEVTAFVEQELEQNPLLEHEEADSAETDSSETGPAETDSSEMGEMGDAAAADFAGGDISGGDISGGDGAGGEGVRDSSDYAQSGDLPSDNDHPLDADFENLWDGAAVDSPVGALTGNARITGTGGLEDDGGEIDRTASAQETLREHLLAQLPIDILDPADRLIGAHLIECLDESGYLVADLDSVAQSFGCESHRVERVLAKLHEFDPPGVFARSLAECLAMQLQDRGKLTPAMRRLLDNLDLLGRHDLHGLAKAIEVPAQRLPEMLAEIRKLNPKPGLAFDRTVTQTIVPDIVVVPTSDGGWHVELNTDTLPRVLVNARYYAQVSSAAHSKEEKEYLSDRFQAANWLVKSLHQRATTILRVAREIVRLQDAFLTHGITRLKPLTLRDVSSAIEMHESTVSRVTSNKYMATPRGLFELKYFFTTAIGQTTGESPFSSESIRFRIRALIEAEIPKRALSDDKIVEVLQAEGIDIARRTVAKYRESMHIPSSVQRRREKLSRAGNP